MVLVKRRPYWVYLLEMANGHIYVGYTSDVERRFEEHASGRGARTTRVFGARRILYQEVHQTRAAAMRREIEIKTWPRAKKLALLEG